MVLSRTMHVQEDRKNKHPTELEGAIFSIFLSE
jgi:hypothetical protein